jgi:G:T-mismatch repair DNA endonuclease (very short patch repair protein)
VNFFLDFRPFDRCDDISIIWMIYWHCNPLKYDANYYNQKKKKFAWELWEYDSSKLDLIRNYGYNLYVIWESDFKNNNKIIEDIISKYARKSNTAP